GQQAADPAVDEIGDRRERLRPQRAVERRVVDGRDQPRQRLVVCHRVAGGAVSVARACPDSIGTCCSPLLFAHVLVGEPVSTSPEHAPDQRFAEFIHSPNTFNQTKGYGGCEIRHLPQRKILVHERAYTDRYERSWAGAQANWSRVQTIVVSHM